MRHRPIDSDCQRIPTHFPPVYHVFTTVVSGIGATPEVAWSNSKKTDPMATVRSSVCVGLLTLLTASLASCQQADVHPGKRHFVDANAWAATSPGDVSLNEFQPFRAVYERNYTQGLGPNAGQPRTDRVIITAERVGWDGIPAIAISLIDSGSPDSEDTLFRGMYSVIAEDDLRLLFEIGPIPGAGKDYYLARIDNGVAKMNAVTTQTGEINVQQMDVTQSGFGPGTWVMANMPLEEGLGIRLDPFYSAKPNPLAGFVALGFATGQESFVSKNGVEFTAWAVDYTSNLQSPVMLRRYLVDSPPYNLGTVRVDLDSGETSDALRLIDFTLFDH